MYDPNDYLPSLGNDLKWYSVDLDKTLADGVWPESKGIGEPIKENIKKLQEVVDAGFKINIHTARSWEEYENIERWLDDHKIPYRRILCGKPLSHRYVDDKAINADEESWL